MLRTANQVPFDEDLPDTGQTASEIREEFSPFRIAQRALIEPEGSAFVEQAVSIAAARLMNAGVDPAQARVEYFRLRRDALDSFNRLRAAAEWGNA